MINFRRAARRERARQLAHGARSSSCQRPRAARRWRRSEPGRRASMSNARRTTVDRREFLAPTRRNRRLRDDSRIRETRHPRPHPRPRTSRRLARTFTVGEHQNRRGRAGVSPRPLRRTLCAGPPMNGTLAQLDGSERVDRNRDDSRTHAASRQVRSDRRADTTAALSSRGSTETHRREHDRERHHQKLRPVLSA